MAKTPARQEDEKAEDVKKHDSEEEEEKKKKKKRKKSRRHESSDSDESSREEKRRKKRRKKHKKSSKKSKKKKSRRESSSSSSDGSSSSSSEDDKKSKKSSKLVVNQRLLEKLAARGETLEEREARRSERRAAKITAKFGYTADDNPFNDPNLHETFSWKKKAEAKTDDANKLNQDHIFGEIEKVRKRRQDRELQFEEMERIRAEESRMKELENYDEWAQKEEEFHLQQQRQRSAIRLVEGREKPVDVLAKNLLMFGVSDQERESRAGVKYQEKYNAINELENLEVELTKPFDILKELKLEELEELLVDIDVFQKLERESAGGINSHNDTVVRYWENLHLLTENEIEILKDGGDTGPKATMVKEIQKLFIGQSLAELVKMQAEIHDRIRRLAHAAAMNQSGQRDVDYWKTVSEQLKVYKAKTELSEVHNKMLVKQLERLEQKKIELETAEARGDSKQGEDEEEKAKKAVIPKNVDPEFGNLEEELGLTDEIDVSAKAYAWQDKFRPRKPRYFHRVRSGYDWNAYNKTHYDQETPPPKVVHGYRFNVFYPDLIDRTKTPQFFLEKADSDEYCIIRFSAGPPYEDIAFKIINREWNRSRKNGYRCTFERGVLTLYFNFKTHWYRR